MLNTKNILSSTIFISLISLPLFTVANTFSATEKHASVAKLADKAPVMAITSTANKLFAVGSYGHILSNSGSEQWLQHTVPTQTLLTGISFSSDNDGWAVGHDATIIHTNDGGTSWDIQQTLPDLDRPLLDVLFLNELEGFAVGAYGMFFHTDDGGQTWHKKFLASLLPEEDVEYLEEVREESEEDYQFEISSILPHFNKIIELDDQQLMLVGELGLIAFSKDRGKTWQRGENIYEGSFFTAIQTQSSVVLVGGLRGNLFRLSPKEGNWKKITLDNSNTINDIYQLANGDIYLSQNTGVVLRSSDDGLSFIQISLQKGQDLMAVRQFNNKIWVAGSKGLNLLEKNK